MTLSIETISNTNLSEVLEYIKKISVTSEQIWGWEAGRFVDWYWGSNTQKLDENPDWYAENCFLFCRESKLVAVVISEYGGKDVCILTESGDPELVQQVLDWLLENRVVKHNGLSFEISDSEIWLADILKAAGFSEKKQTGHEWEYNLSQVSNVSKLPAGYSLETLAEADNQDLALAGIARVIKAAFKSKESEEMLVKILMSLQKNPLYLPELSVYARDEVGNVTSYCRGTINSKTGFCAIDPVCCHPEFQRKGLTTAVVEECFRRQAGLGGKFSYIGSAPIPAPSTLFYKSLQPSRYRTFSRWTIEGSR